MKERVSTAHRRADGALVVAISFVILGVAPLISINIFAETLNKVFSPGPSAAKAVESPVELAAARLTAESQCLAEAMYFEARGEGIDGQKAVAEVVLQRTRNRNYGNTVCSVVYEGVERGRRDCQFSFACDGSPEHAKEESVWAETKLLAEKIMTGQVRQHGQDGADRQSRVLSFRPAQRCEPEPADAAAEHPHQDPEHQHRRRTAARGPVSEAVDG
jgi:hypothetical protein